jgi:hypothetical protein
VILSIVVTGSWCSRRLSWRHAVVASRCAGCSSTAAATNRDDHVRVLGRLAVSSKVFDLAGGRVLVLRRSTTSFTRSGKLARLDI